MFPLCFIPHFHCMEISFCFMKSLGKVGPVVKGDRRVGVARDTKGARFRFSHPVNGVRKAEPGAATVHGLAAGGVLPAGTGATAQQASGEGRVVVHELLHGNGEV